MGRLLRNLCDLQKSSSPNASFYSVPRIRINARRNKERDKQHPTNQGITSYSSPSKEEIYYSVGIIPKETSLVKIIQITILKRTKQAYNTYIKLNH